MSILIIGAWGIYVSNQAKIKDEQIIKLEGKIDSLKNINSIKANDKKSVSSLQRKL